MTQIFEKEMCPTCTGKGFLRVSKIVEDVKCFKCKKKLEPSNILARCGECLIPFCLRCAEYLIDEQNTTKGSIDCPHCEEEYVTDSFPEQDIRSRLAELSKVVTDTN
jgi:transposase-like protein